MVRARFAGLSQWLVLLLAFVTAALSGQPAFAQTPTPSADQISIFQNLPPDQQQAVMEAMGGNTRGRVTDRVQSDKKLQFPQTVGERRARKDDEDEDSEYGYDAQGFQTKLPRFKADDSLLINLELKKYEDERQQSQQGQQQGQLPNQAPGRFGNQNPVIPGSQPTIPGQATNGANSQLAANDRERIERSEEAQRRLNELRERIQRRNPYKLDKWGILTVPELGPIPLAGLTVDQADQRLAAETSLSEFTVNITRLPLKRVGTEALKPFGYDLFAGEPSTFAPATDVPVPAEYVVGPGDTIEVQLVGNTKGRYALVVGRDGRVNFPEIGPIVVSGQRFEQVRQSLEARVREQMIGTQASVSIGELRSIRVFVLGDAEMPGSYTVSGLSTITNALFVSGGVKKIGSLRNIQLKRAGQTVTTLDLYDMLLNGDTRADTRLLPGDVIFIPPVGATVSVAGEVRRPAIYELKNETSTADLIRLAGGLTDHADPALATIERVNDSRQRVTLDIDLTAAAGVQSRVQNGDLLRVREIRPVLEDSVSLSGHVYRPGEFQFRPSMKLTDLIPSIDELKPNSDHQYILVRRELPPDRRITVFSANLDAALQNPNSSANFELAPRDRVYVFDLESGRDRIVEPLMRDLNMQSQIDSPTSEVNVAGKVKVPGKYPLEPGMRVSDLIRAGGGLSEAAYGGEAELTRYTVENDQSRQAELIKIDLRKVLDGDAAANVPLKPFDYLVIKEVPLWASQEEVEIQGEVRFPGRYPIHRGETLRSVLERAGGLTDFAFAEGAVFTRRELRERERKQLEQLAGRMQSDLAQLSLMAAQETGKDPGSALAVGNSLLASLKNTPPVGRLVINLDQSMKAAPSSEQDVILKDGDRLIVPRVTQEVTVLGEVQSTTSHLYNPELSRDDYIAMSGGLTQRGDKKHVYVVRANGSVETGESGRWFNRGGVDIKPGDTVVVPLDAERMRPLPFWQAVTSIVYNLAIAAAAVNSF
jgi:polysaccharide export outer membrane protein